MRFRADAEGAERAQRQRAHTRRDACSRVLVYCTDRMSTEDAAIAEAELAALGEAELRSFDGLCSKLRSDLNKAFDLKGTGASAAPARIQLAEGAFTLLELKTVNRRVWELVGELKARSQAANAAIDTADLKLQNLQYEKNHFLREIRHCRSFKSDERHIELMPVDEFLKHAPAAFAGVSQDADPHQFHLNRLELEQKQRQRSESVV